MADEFSESVGREVVTHAEVTAKATVTGVAKRLLPEFVKAEQPPDPEPAPSPGPFLRPPKPVPLPPIPEPENVTQPSRNTEGSVTLTVPLSIAFSLAGCY